MKKKKDLLNHTKQKALKKTSDPGQTKPKSKAKKTNSAPILVKSSADIAENEAETEVEAEQAELKPETNIKVETRPCVQILRNSPDIGQVCKMLRGKGKRTEYLREEINDLRKRCLLSRSIYLMLYSFILKDNETDTDSEEILQRDAAIAKAELEAAHLQREIQETEQAELTDTGGIFRTYAIIRSSLLNAYNKGVSNKNIA